jgi:hypothetical protein
MSYSNFTTKDLKDFFGVEEGFRDGVFADAGRCPVSKRFKSYPDDNWRNLKLKG